MTYIPMISGSLDKGTATSVDQTSWPSFRKASMLHSASLRADHSSSWSSGDVANSKLPALCCLAIVLTIEIFSLTPARVPENLYFCQSQGTNTKSSDLTHLKNMVGTSFQVFLVACVLFITLICTSSITSIAATGTPARMI